MRPDARKAWPRTRLFRLLDAALWSRVIWVSAPAGSGKTTLASSYIDARNLSALWYQVDPGDRDIGSFFHFLALAANDLPAKTRHINLPSLSPDRMSGLDDFTRAYMRQLFSWLAPNSMLVLDNYQDAQGNQLDNVIRIAAAELPAGVNMMVLSRMPPPPSCSSLLVNGTVALLDETQLNMDAEETSGIARHLDADASDDAIEGWHQRVRGWVAGLVLLARAGRHIDPDSGMRDIRSLLSDYFAAEIMSHLSEAERDFLLRVPFLGKMTAAGGAELGGYPQGGDLLERLHVQNYFTSRHHDTYQFHPLFQDYLLEEAHRCLPGAELATLRARAARILLAEGRLSDAIELLIEASHWRELARLIPEHASAVAAQGRLATLQRWLEAIPRTERDAHPWLGFWLGVCRLPYDPREASLGFAACIPRFEQSNDLPGLAASWSKLIESILHDWGDISRLDEPIALMHRVIRDENFHMFPARLAFEVIQNALLALIWRQPEHPGLADIETRARELLQTCANPAQQTVCAIYLSLYYCWSGKYARARMVAASMRAAMELSPLPPLMLSAAKVTECLTAWRIDADFERCLAEAEAALRLCSESGVRVWETNLVGQVAAAHLSWGDMASAAAALERMRLRLPQSRRFDAGQYFLLAGWHAWAAGDGNLAKEHITNAIETFEALGVPWGIGFSHVAYALTMGHTDPDYERHMALAMQQVQRHASTEIEYPALLARIRTALDCGYEQESLQLIARLFRIGAQEGVWNCYYWEPRLMARICVKALEAGIEPDYADKLIRMRQLLPPDPALAPENWPWPVTVHTLGGLTVHVDGKLLPISGKGPAKPLALLQLLVAYGGRDIAEHKVTDALWPDADADAASRALDTTLARLRKLLGNNETILLRNRRLSLDPDRVWVDALAFSRLVNVAGEVAPEMRAVRYRRAAALYRGPFLDDDDSPAVIALRSRLQREFLQALSMLGRLHEASGEWEQAIQLYEHGLTVEFLAEPLYQLLMIAYRQLGRQAEALSVYERCRRALSAALGIVPSPATEAVHLSLRQVQ